MKAIIITFDSLNKHWLQAYGAEKVPTPNFTRLAENTVKFNNAYIGSMPCMPARRDMHTGRLNFMHTNWGGLEPYDFSVFESLKNQGIYTHHCTDHYHYWESGGSHYMQKYQSHEMHRGQEGDAWIPGPTNVEMPTLPEWGRRDAVAIQDERNRDFLKSEVDWPIHKTFTSGVQFLDKNQEEDNWLLHIETFDPHEPFFAPERFRNKVEQFTDKQCDWPHYGRVSAFDVKEDELEQMKSEYAALLMFCDEQLGRILDKMDAYNLWEDTLLIVNTDHGFLIGEHDMMGKCVMNPFNEIANIPFFVWDPRSKTKNEERQSLIQNIDLAPTLLHYFQKETPSTVTGKNIQPCIENDESVRDEVIFGLHGQFLGIITQNGQCAFVYPDENIPLHAHTLDYSHMRGLINPDIIKQKQPDKAYNFTQGCVLDKYPTHSWKSENGGPYETVLYDLNQDPDQKKPFMDKPILEKLLTLTKHHIDLHDAPEEFYLRYGLN